MAGFTIKLINHNVEGEFYISADGQAEANNIIATAKPGYWRNLFYDLTKLESWAWNLRPEVRKQPLAYRVLMDTDRDYIEWAAGVLLCTGAIYIVLEDGFYEGRSYEKEIVT